ncbi:hypothetical protein G7B40_016165 [Aetokthonos hydrillicola Thurmond2011]|jgi:hypothetical protein|uniref:STAS domain-containing protein n=1 Tax=Aetokthonos hydrillicola Thurmond2011 TaxID=2712845 RepID=A0AAP5M9U1_9CYAN|nr:hypothetical protein [Aetokthonos hydrillicola]MBO3458717.1 hypothetical protein [Aetokthonos hydrillicola CCALA 1050]MBW4585466.1 hypothetical protein [Aetokthonos hydrillicola CCALA 1050]MDR9896087.1 hypothetical protein [Aetokthonos hydrillicola Thurmond2011]
MIAQQIKGDDYQVQYEPESTTVYFKGQITLGKPSEYAPLVNLLNEVAASEPKNMTLNVKELAFLNSSGISMLSKFVLGMRKKKGTQLVVLGSKKMPWQSKSLKNLERLLPGLKLVVE